MNSKEKKRTPLYRQHIRLGAKMVPFAGWEMPLNYPRGIIKEHLYTRNSAGLFDISHMGELFLEGVSAESDLQRLFTADIGGLGEGRAKYGFFLDRNGHFLDDLIVFKFHSEKYLLVVNAARVQTDKEWISEHLSAGSELTDISDRTGKIDIQGPLSPAVTERFLQDKECARIKRFSFVRAVVCDADVILSRTGYTGEEGFEIFCEAEDAAGIWEAFLAEDEVEPVGLGARDTLRLEMGYPLYGNDIDQSHKPTEAGLMRFVDIDKDFIGRGALLEEPEYRLSGFVLGSRRSARRGFTVLADDGPAGEVTSASYSPSTGQGIGLCYVRPEAFSPGVGLSVSDGKRTLPIELRGLPFYQRNSN